MKLRTILSSITMVSAICMMASPISPQKALERTKASQTRHARSATAAPVLIDTFYGKDGMPAIYLFSYAGSEGFMLISADDAVAPLLGYSETGSFPTDNLSPSMQSWLSLYTGQIVDGRNLPPYQAIATRASENPAIAPMLTTQWDQSYPFNLNCPMVNGYRAVTGCVATAMAQVMNYWKYPSVGKGSLTYTSENISEPLSIDFSETYFDWDNMLDKYTGMYGPEQRQAVATLMQACGYSVKMGYAFGSSGAYTRDVPSALTSYFGYDRGISRKDRDTYSSQNAWNQMIYTSLANVGPVIYAGRSEEGGHCFVCDGYDGNGMYHINWGWNGVADGYFLLNELTPSEIGTGGHYGGYNMDQQAVIDIMPPAGRLAGDLSVDNATSDSGMVSGKGFIYRINDPNNVLLTANLTVSGGHVSSPLYFTVYETDPTTLKNDRMVIDSTFPQPVNDNEGSVSRSARFSIDNFNPGKLYSVTLSYELKNQKNIITSIRLGASAGVGDLIATDNGLKLVMEGNRIKVESSGEAVLLIYDVSGSPVASAQGISPEISSAGIPAGIYIARATSLSGGETRTLKLLLK